MDSLVLGILVVVAIIGFLIYVISSPSKLDVNSDGVVDSKDAKDALNKVVNTVKSTADLNKDGVVNTEDAKLAGTKVKDAVDKGVKKARSKIKT